VKLIVWGDVVHYAIYFKNRFPSYVINSYVINNNMTSYEMWCGFLSLVRHLWFFGSIYYALVPKEQKSNLVPRVVNAFFGVFRYYHGFLALQGDKKICSSF